MTADEFRVRHKRVFVALEGHYRWGRRMSGDDSYVIAWDDGQNYQLRIYESGKFPFVLRRWGGQKKRYTRESSVLAALAKIHAGETP